MYLEIIPFSKEFYTIFIFNLVVLIAKLFLILYLGMKLVKTRNNPQIVAGSFVSAIFFMITTLFISRIFYMIFDFNQTLFDMELYPKYNMTWRIATTFSLLGMSYVLYIVDKTVFKLKYKGLPSYFVIVFIIFFLLYPVNTINDFQLISALIVIPMLLFIPIIWIFIKMGIQSSGELRKNSFMFALGMTLYVIAALLVNASVVGSLNNITENADVILYFIQMIFKVVGITLLAVMATRFHL